MKNKFCIKLEVGKSQETKQKIYKCYTPRTVIGINAMKTMRTYII